MVRPLALLGSILAGVCLAAGEAAALEWPVFPAENATLELPAQEWPQRPGPRTIRVKVYFPGQSREHVIPETGVMLTLHNWGGEDCIGTADPQMLADRLNVVALCVNYLQSGRRDSVEAPEPYDFGYLQGLDALRAVWFVMHGLDEAKIPFHRGRIYATGGSGGGNVTLMAHKLAPRTFTAIIDMCGMKKLSDDIAFDLPGGSTLNARYSRDPQSPNYLSIDEQELRFVGHPAHLKLMKEWKSPTHRMIVHGVDDSTCPYADAVELVEHLQTAGLPVEQHWIDQSRVDGTIFKTTGHALGNRTLIALSIGERWMDPASPQCLIRTGPTDFDLKDETVRYPTTNGEFVIDYQAGYPVGRFEPAAPVPASDPRDLGSIIVADGQARPIETVADWEQRRQQIRRQFERATGPLPSPLSRVALKPEVISEERGGSIIRRKLRFQSDSDDAVSAWLLIPEQGSSEKRPAMLCLHQTVAIGKDEPAGLGGNPNYPYALELAQRGYVTLAVDYPSFGEHPYDFAAHPQYVSGTMKAIWDNIRAVDLLVSLPEVDAERIGVIGHSLGGHNAIFTAVFEPRLKVIVSSCGFSMLTTDDVPSWTGPVYMPRIGSEFGNDPARVPFDFPSLIASLAPRAVFISAPLHDADFDVAGVKETVRLAQPIYQLYGAGQNLQAVYPDAPHDFPPAAREAAYAFIDGQLNVGSVAPAP